MEKGDAENAVSLFHGLLQRQKEYGCTASAVRNSGMSLQERCRKLLMEGERMNAADRAGPEGSPIRSMAVSIWRNTAC